MDSELKTVLLSLVKAMEIIIQELAEIKSKCNCQGWLKIKPDYYPQVPYPNAPWVDPFHDSGMPRITD